MSDEIGRGVLEVVGDTSGFEAAMAKAEAAAERFERTATKAAGKGAGAFGAAGKGAGAGANELDSASKRYVASLEREIATLTLSRAEYRKWEAQVKGISESTYAPLIQRLKDATDAQDKLRAKTAATAGGLNLVGISAGQATNAMRQLPAQITDIVTGLASGQSAFTVLIQQGGQLKDSFGGVGNVFKALGTLITPTAVAFGAAAASIAGLAGAFIAGANESAALAKSLAITGNAAGLTEARFNSLSRALSETTNTSIGSAREALSALAGSGLLSGEALAKTGEAVQRLAKATGQSTADVAKQFLSLTDNVSKGAAELNKQYNFLTAEQFAYIKSLEATGQTQKAVSVTMDALNARIGDQTPNLGLLERAWSSVTRKLSEYVDVAKGVGRTETPVDKLATVQAQLDSVTPQRDQAVGRTRAALDETVKALEAQRDALREVVTLQNRAADAAARSAEANKAGIELGKIGDQFKSPGAVLKDQVEQVRNLGAQAGKTASEIQQLVGQVTAYSQAAALGVAAAQAKLGAAAQLDAAKTAGALERLQSQAAAGLLNEYQLIEQIAAVNVKASKAEEERLARQIDIAKSVPNNAAQIISLQGQLNAQIEQTANIENKAAADVEAALKRRRDAAAAALIAERELTAAEQAAADRAYTDKRNAAAEAIRQYGIALEDSAYAYGVETQAAMLNDREREIALRRLQIELDTRRRIREVRSKGLDAKDEEINVAAITAQAKAQSEAVVDQVTSEFQTRGAAAIQSSLLDALTNGFGSAWDYLKKLAKKEVITMTFEPLLKPLSAGLAGLLPSVAGASGGVASAAQGANLLGNLGNLGSLFTSGLSNTLGTLATSAGSLFGSSALSTFATGMQGANLAAGLAGPTTAGAGGLLGAGASFSAAVPYLAGALALFSAKDSLFGRKLQDTSITGTLGGSAGFSGSTESFFKGGLFRSNKTTTEALSGDVSGPIAQAALGIKKTVSDYAAALNLPVDQIASYTEAIKFSTKGLSAEQIQSKLQEALVGFGDKLAGTLGDSLTTFSKSGEKAGETLARLAGAVQGVNPVLEQLGLKLFDVSTVGADAASKLVDAFGSLDNLTQASATYYQAYYSDAERAAKATESITKTLGDLGIAMPASKEQFRALVEAQDRTTDSGLQAFATLLKVSGAFDEVQSYAQDTADAATEAAKKIADAAQALRDDLGKAIDQTVGKFLTPEQSASRGYAKASSQLSAVGINVGADQLLALTKAQVFDLAKAFVETAGNSDEAKLAVVNVASSLADLKDASEATAKAAKDAADSLARDLAGAINANVDKFLTPQQARARQVAGISDSLAAVGVNFSPEKLLSATKTDIFEFAKSFVAAADNSVEAKLAVVEAAGALADLADAAKDLAKSAIQAQIDALTRKFGDVEGALTGPVETLADAFSRGKQEIKGLEDGLANLLGTTAKSVQEVLADMLRNQQALASFRAGLGDTIENARLSTLSPSARAAALRQREASLFGQLGTASDPVAIAQKLQQTITDRIALESSLSVKVYDDQIASLERLRDLSKELAQFTADLRIGDLSPLSPAEQLAQAQALFDRTLTGAQSGDATAVGALTGNAKTYLDEARGYFASSSAYADIFAKVTASLDALGLAGATADPQITALEAVRDSVSGGAQAQLDAFTALDEALRNRAESDAAAIEAQTQLARDQITQAKADNEALRLQVSEVVDQLTKLREEFANVGSAVDSIGDTLERAEAGS